MAEIKISFDDSIEVSRSLKDCYAWATHFPDCFNVFPLIKNIKEVKKDSVYRFTIGPFGYKKYSAMADFEASITKKKDKEIHLRSIPGSGNSDVEMSFLFEEKGPKETRLRFTVNGTSDQSLPRLLPVSLVQAAVKKTAQVTMKQGLKNARKAVEAEFPA